MNTRPLFGLLALGLVAAWLVLPGPARGALPDQSPSDDQIRDILRQRIDGEKRGVGLVVGWVDEHGSRVVSYGRTSLVDGREVDGKTLFEIGSVTKVFTATLLAQAVERGEMKLDDPVAKYLPAEVKVPGRGERQITLLDLATHRSGLPRMPENMQPRDKNNPAADYTLPQMYAFLTGYTLTREPGSEFEYSNFGEALLGQVLVRNARTDYETLVTRQICQPLGMADTCITLTPELRARLASPYNESLAPSVNWDLGALAPAGALRSDADDLLKFLTASIGLTPSPVTPALMATHRVRNQAGKSAIGLNWFVLKEHQPPITWHNGGTAGYRSFVGFDTERKRGVAVLSNTANGVDDIGLHLLNAAYPLDEAPAARTVVAIKPEVADLYAGPYQLTPKVVLTFTREGSRYFVQASGEERNEMFPDSETEFFSKEADVQVSFDKDPSGKVTTMVLHQSGNHPAPRLP